MKNTIILGAGNELMKDEGVGVHLVRILQNEPRLPTLNVITMDIGTSPDFAHLIEGVQKLIIVDAVKGGCEPGTIYRFTHDQIESEFALTTSLHQVGLLENLRMMELTGSEPDETVVIGIEPAEVGLGLELSHELEHQMPKLVRTVLQEIGSSTGTVEINNETRM